MHAEVVAAALKHQVQKKIDLISTNKFACNLRLLIPQSFRATHFSTLSRGIGISTKFSCSRSRLLSRDSPNRKRGVVKREPIDNGWYGEKASRVTLTTWKVERHWVLRTKAVNGYVLVLVASYT